MVDTLAPLGNRKRLSTMNRWASEKARAANAALNSGSDAIYSEDDDFMSVAEAAARLRNRVVFARDTCYNSS